MNTFCNLDCVVVAVCGGVLYANVVCVVEVHGGCGCGVWCAVVVVCVSLWYVCVSLCLCQVQGYN